MSIPAVGWVVGIIGVAATLYTLMDFRRIWRVRYWPRARGRILESALEEQSTSDSYYQSLRLAYVYQVDGKEFKGRRLKAGGNLSLTIGNNSGDAWSTAADDQRPYAAGDPVEVYYNPANPGECCLEQGGWANALAELTVSAGILVLASRLVLGDV